MVQSRPLADVIEQGVFPEILSAIGRGTDLGSHLKSSVAAALFRGFSNRILESVSEEFRTATAALVDGYRSGLASPRFTRQQAIDAVVAIDSITLPTESSAGWRRLRCRRAWRRWPRRSLCACTVIPILQCAR